jgi:outer membrane receptor protein involved in Fe transport
MEDPMKHPLPARRDILMGASLVALALGATPAAAQTPPAATTAEAETAPEMIVVTGSNIRGATDTGAIAVSILTQTELESFGATSTGELFSFIAQAGAAEINTAADGPNDARGDVATVNLRGLGTGNTLVLLNGRRIAAHAVNQDIGSTPRQVTNVNAFPAVGIDRVEVLRDGASALYGADATAGVVNSILNANFNSIRLQVRYDFLEDANSDEFTIDGGFGLKFNEGRTKVLVSGSWYSRDGFSARELGPQFNSVDKRAFLGNSPFATTTTDFRNTSTSSPFGQYQAGFVNAQGVFQGRRIRRGTTNLTSTTGVFHIQPCSFPGTLQPLITGSEGCMGLDDGTLDVNLRYDFNANQPNNSLNQGVNITNDGVTALGRQLVSDAERLNLYSIAEHEFGNGMEAFGEVLYYKASTFSNRAAQPLDSGLAFLIVPRTNYWNPFGPVGSPNRIPGLNTTDVPATGVDVLLQNWRPTDLGVRFIETETSTYRVLGGLRGNFGAWEWESAVGHSANETTDTESNRLSKTLLQAELSKNTPDAINPFGGPNANTQAQWDRARISSTNIGKTSLTTADFRISNSEAVKGWAAPIGFAAGIDYRHEYYEEDRDPRLDGTIIFSTENVSGGSDVVGVSPTRDSSASRNVISAYAEALVPIIRSDRRFVGDVTLQLAGRVEHFDDVNATAVKPKFALSWQPVRAIALRGAWSGGFRAPNLVQLNRGDVSRLNLGIEDFWRADVTGDPASTGDAYVASVRKSNPNLENEDTETLVAGFTIDFARALDRPVLKALTISFDYWRFDQFGVIGAFGDEEAMALDFLLRKQGSSNPNVVRLPVTPLDEAAFAAWNVANPNDIRAAAGQVANIVDPYINLDRQTADGFDFGLASQFDLGRAGGFRLSAEATYLMTLNVFRNELLTAIANDPLFGSAFDSLAVDRIRLDGNPRWRATASFAWDKGIFELGGSVRYVSGFQDTNADIVVNGQTVFWQVESDVRLNLYAEVEAPLLRDRSARIRFGVNNALDRAPPLVDESLGYRPDYHSLTGREYFVALRGNF